MKRTLIVAGAILLLPALSFAEPNLASKAQPSTPGGPSVKLPSGLIFVQRGSQRFFTYHGRRLNRINVPVFRVPPGFSHRTWRTGDRLPSAFMTPDYFFTGYQTVGLDAPPEGRQYVRYENNLLLVNVSDGRIEEVIPDAFNTTE